MAEALAAQRALTALSKYYDQKSLSDFFGERDREYAFYSTGITSGDLDKLRSLKKKITISKICIEVANGYIPSLKKFVSAIRKELPNAIILAGSVCTPEGTIDLIKAGADIIRVGIGSGSVCLTRKVAGVGYPQLSAILECSEAAHQQDAFVCSDGGCVVPGDVCKALGAGADFVMLGGMLAGHDECDGKIRYVRRGKRRVPASMTFYGMASAVAQTKHFGGLASYKAVEGKEVSVPYRGAVSATMQEIEGGLRSMMTYVDAKEVSEISSKTNFVRVRMQTNDIYSG